MGGRGVFVYLAGEIQFSETVPGRLGQGFQAGISGPGKTRGMGRQTIQPSYRWETEPKRVGRTLPGSILLASKGA